MYLNLTLCPFISTLLEIGFLAGAILVQAQSSRILGSWMVDVTRTGIPGLPAFGVSINQLGDTLVYLTSVLEPSVDSLKTIKKLVTDGREVHYSNQKGNRLPCSAWYSADTLIIRFASEQYRKGKKTLLTMVEKYWLSEDKETLLILHSEGSPGRMGFYPKPIILTRMNAIAGRTPEIPIFNLESCNPPYPAPALAETSSGAG